jgi:hypothetical protein
MSIQTAKSKVCGICAALKSVCPDQSDDQIQEAAIDLHDIEIACRKIARAVRVLRTGAASKESVADQLCEIEGELIDHVAQNHLPSLKRFLAARDALASVKAKRQKRGR